MDVDRLLDPIEGDSPSGVELRNDVRFHSIERLLDPAERRNRVNQDGSNNLSAAEAEWQSVFDEGMALAADGRDLRLLTILVRAMYKIEGFAGLAQGMSMLTDTLDRYWDDLHPELRDRPDPGMAALPRTNALKQLENDDNGLLGDIKFSPVFIKRGLGPIWGIDLAASAMTDFEVRAKAPDGLNDAEMAAIVDRHSQTANRVTAATRALAAEEEDVARGIVEGISSAEAALMALTAKFGEKGGFEGGMGLSLPELTEVLSRCKAAMLAAFGESEGAAASDGGAESDAGTPAAPGGGGGVSVSAPGSIGSRADVIATLDRIVAYYDKAEPSSPIPFFVKRIKKMVPMDFTELMAEVAPGGVKDFNSLAGIEDTGGARRRSAAKDE